MLSKVFRAAVLAAAASAMCAAATIAPGFSSAYNLVDLGSVTGVPTNYGGLTFLDDSDLLLGGAANGGSGAIYDVPVTRDPITGQITSLGTPTLYATSPFIDGGLVFGPNGVLFATGFPNNTLLEYLPGATAPSETIDLTALGVQSSVGTVQFVPNGYAGAGEIKIASYDGGEFYDATLTQNSGGTYDLSDVTLETTPGGGPEGIIYVPGGSPDFSSPTALVSLYSDGVVEAYSLDADSNPIPATATDFITGLSGAEGATIDPVTGDFLFSTFGGGNQIVEVQGFAVPVTTPEPASLLLLGAGLAGFGLLRRRKV